MVQSDAADACDGSLAFDAVSSFGHSGGSNSCFRGARTLSYLVEREGFPEDRRRKQLAIHQTTMRPATSAPGMWADTVRLNAHVDLSPHDFSLMFS